MRGTHARPSSRAGSLDKLCATGTISNTAEALQSCGFSERQ